MSRSCDLTRRFPELGATNEAQRTLSWFLGKVTCDDGFDRNWQDCKQRMEALNARKNLLRLMPPEHDFWLCKSANPKPPPENHIFPLAPDFQPWSVQVWQPPSAWWQWPTFDVDRENWISDHKPRIIRPMDGFGAATWQGDTEAERSRAQKILREIGTNGPSVVENTVRNQCVAWLDTALGRLGRFVQEGNCDIEPTILVRDLAEHVLVDRSEQSSHTVGIADFVVVGDPSVMRKDMAEDSLERLYGAALKEDGSALLTQFSPRGQSPEWRDYFRAIGYDLAPGQALASVQLTALMLRSESVWKALSVMREAASDFGDELTDFVMCVRRRWYLALRSLVWLERSLERAHSVDVLCPADFVSFAITSLLPVYPRALVVLSHRGADAKERLIKSKAWGTNEILIDATFQPEWQTSRAMMWSLFSSTPAICKIRSPRYATSIWCMRESEMFRYLVEAEDFVDGRNYFEIELDEIESLEGAGRSSSTTHRHLDAPSGLESPPFEIRKLEAWQGAMVRATAIAKFIHRFFVIAAPENQSNLIDLANKFLEYLCNETSELSDDSLLGFDHIWHRLAGGLRADAEALKLRAPLAKLLGSSLRREAVDDANEANAWFERHAGCVPDPKSSELNVCDLLAALEWRDYLEGLLRDHNKGTIFENQAAFIDLRGVTEEQWITDPGWTVARALLLLRLPYPLLVRQIADQGVESWPLIREVDPPIFTQHHPDQVVPQSEVFFSLGGPWPAVYFNAVSHLVEMSPQLAYACQNSLKLGDDPVLFRADRGLSSLGADFVEWLQKHEGHIKGDES